MGNDRKKLRSTPIMFLKLGIGLREFLGTLPNAFFQMLSQLGQISVSRGIVNGCRDMASDSQ